MNYNYNFLNLSPMASIFTYRNINLKIILLLFSKEKYYAVKIN